ncbi:MAG: phosphate ABC transporter substrate-binding protein [Blastopirellula sp.]|nr:MAG: phosphate ABC transporter substrate-binding protein [Blastopirellula sp.]
MRYFIILCALAGLTSVVSPVSAAEKTNILWVFVEDMSPWIGSYGDEINKDHTPNIDALADRGVQFNRCYVPAPVCSACRSAMITGAMQTTTGTHNHRSSRTEKSAIHLPEGIRTLPEIFKQAGYFTFNQGKEDYNFMFEMSDLYATVKGDSPWEGRKKGQPFFGQIQLKGGKTNTRKLKADQKVDPADVTVPAYFPDHEIYRNIWASHYDTIRATDTDLGNIVASLKEDNLLDSTIIFFFTDHGQNHSVRHKQFCYEGGVHVPLVIAGPSKLLKAGTVRDDLVSGLDISAATLAFAGLKIPGYVEGQDLFAKDFTPREFVISARDRCDYTIDRTRTVRTDKFRYLRNFKTDRPLLQPQYRDGQAYVKFLRAGHEAGTLPKLTEQIFFGKRPAEELYDMKNDPDELNNLVNDPKYAKVLAQHRGILNNWIKETGDLGQHQESDAGLQATLDRWKAKCVNPEYDHLKK